MTPAPADGPEQPDRDGADTDRQSRVRLRRIAGGGVVLGLVVAVLAGLGGATGRAGAAIFLLLSATACAVAAMYGAITAVRDDLRDAPVSRARVAWVVALFFASATLMAMTAGVGG